MEPVLILAPHPLYGPIIRLAVNLTWRHSAPPWTHHAGRIETVGSGGAGGPTDVPSPPDPFDAATEQLRRGHRLYRVGNNRRSTVDVNPGVGSNDSRAVMLFGDPAGDAVAQDVSFGRIFSSGPGLDWLIDTCATLHIDVLPPGT
jgi:hypothetical protein